MNRYLNRWTLALGWSVLMAIACALFVPKGLSVTTIILMTGTGLAVSLFGFALLSDSEPPRSMNQILVELEADSRTARPPLV